MYTTTLNYNLNYFSIFHKHLLMLYHSNYRIKVILHDNTVNYHFNQANYSNIFEQITHSVFWYILFIVSIVVYQFKKIIILLYYFEIIKGSRRSPVLLVPITIFEKVVAATILCW